MTPEQERAHARLMRTLTVHTHWKESPPEINLYSGRKKSEKKRLAALSRTKERIDTFARKLIPRRSHGL